MLLVVVAVFIRSRDPCHKSLLTPKRIVKNTTKIYKSLRFCDIFIIETRVVMVSRISVKGIKAKIIQCRNLDRGRERASDARCYGLVWLHSLVYMLHLSRYLHLASELLFCILFSRSMTSKLGWKILERGERVWRGEKKRDGKDGEGWKWAEIPVSKIPKQCASLFLFSWENVVSVGTLQKTASTQSHYEWCGGTMKEQACARPALPAAGKCYLLKD